MNINEIIGLLKKITKKDIDLRLYFTRKKQNNKYWSYSPTTSRDLQVELNNIILEALDKVKDAEQRPFSPIGSVDGCIETHIPNEINSFNSILESIDEDIVTRRNISADEISKLTFYCLKLHLGDNGDILFFRRVTKFNKLKRGIVGNIVDGDFEKIDNSLLGLDPIIDIIVYQGQMVILNHISLERIFSINDQYQEKAGQTLDLVRHSNRIKNFEQFREDCLSDGRVTRALTKLLTEEDRIHQVFENFDNVIRVIDIFSLNIELEDENTKLVYEDKSQLLDITRLMRDSFYRSLINNREGVDEGL